MERKPIYRIGDNVRIVNYGHPIWENKNTEQLKTSFPLISEDDKVRWLDMSSDLVGQEGIVSEVLITQGVPKYAIDGINGKHAWYQEGQLEMINQNPKND